MKTGDGWLTLGISRRGVAWQVRAAFHDERQSMMPKGVKRFSDDIMHPALEHFAAKWNRLASHKCGKNKEIELFGDSMKC